MESSVARRRPIQEPGDLMHAHQQPPTKGRAPPPIDDGTGVPQARKGGPLLKPHFLSWSVWAGLTCSGPTYLSPLPTPGQPGHPVPFTSRRSRPSAPPVCRSACAASSLRASWRQPLPSKPQAPRLHCCSAMVNDVGRRGRGLGQLVPMCALSVSLP